MTPVTEGLGVPAHVSVPSALSRFLKGGALPAFFLLAVATAFAGGFLVTETQDACQDYAWENMGDVSGPGFDYKKYQALKIHCFKAQAPVFISGAIGSFALAALGLGMMASFFAWMGHRRRMARLRATYGPRSASAREWFVRGEIDEGQYTRLQELWRQVLDGRRPGDAARTGGSWWVMVGAFHGLIALACALVLVLTLSILPHEFGTDEYTLMWISIPGLLMSVGLVGIGFRTGVRHVRLGNRSLREVLQAVEHDETGVLAEANERARGAKRLRGGARGPSFSPYGSAVADPGVRAPSEL